MRPPNALDVPYLGGVEHNCGNFIREQPPPQIRHVGVVLLISSLYTIPVPHTILRLPDRDIHIGNTVTNKPNQHDARSPPQGSPLQPSPHSVSNSLW